MKSKNVAFYSAVRGEDKSKFSELSDSPATKYWPHLRYKTGLDY